MPDFCLLKAPSFSVGWLAGFKRRHHIKKFRQSDESGSADIESSLEQIQRVKTLISLFGIDNTYNADETALYWLATPDTTLATCAQKGRKKQKDRITIFPCSNASSTHKLDLWILGKAKCPRAFGNDAIYIRNLPVVWRNNKTAYMTATIFIEYLYWFDRQMAGRRVLLLVDGFSAHVSAVKQLKEQHGDQYLRNTTIEFLPANTTSIYQPMDQGIINSLKLQY
ncbi:DDE-domain-containing protein [Neurospora crassa]|nr:DDE-domain-containing protein [Neurospora crassa]